MMMELIVTDEYIQENCDILHFDKMEFHKIRDLYQNFKDLTPKTYKILSEELKFFKNLSNIIQKVDINKIHVTFHPFILWNFQFNRFANDNDVMDCFVKSLYIDSWSNDGFLKMAIDGEYDHIVMLIAPIIDHNHGFMNYTTRALFIQNFDFYNKPINEHLTGKTITELSDKIFDQVTKNVSNFS